jgi:EpsI family protein
VGFVILATVAPIIANGLRVYFTILIGETWGVRYASGTDHMIFGWQFFGTVLVLLLLVGWFFRDRLVPGDKPVPNLAPVAGSRMLLWPAALALLVAGPLAAASITSAPVTETVQLSPPSLAGWSAPAALQSDWQPSFQGAAGQFHVGYRSPVDRAIVEVFHAVYTGKPRRGHNLITYGNNVYDPDQSQILASGKRRVELAGGAAGTVRELRLTGAADTSQRLVWYWYCVDARCTASSVPTKMRQAWDLLRGRSPRSSVWALSMPIDHGDVVKARKHLDAFARGLSLSGMEGAAP